MVLLLGRSAAASELSEFLSGGAYPSGIRQIAHELVLGVGSSGTLYWLSSIPLFILLLVLALLPFARRPGTDAAGHGGRARAVFYSAALYCVVVSLCIVAFRWPTLSLAECNPDESEQISGAITLCHDPVFWRSVDGATRGPLPYYALILPRLFAVPIDYGSAKLVALLFMICSALLLYAALRKVMPEGLARLGILPAATCISLLSYRASVTYNDYLAYNGEHVTILLLSLGLYLFIRVVVAPPSALRRWAFLAGLVAGSVPFAKLQGVPSAAVLVLMCFVALCARLRQSRAAAIRSMVWLAVGGLVFPLLVLALLFSFGVWHDFWQSYIANNLLYATRKELGFGDKIIAIIRLIRRIPDTRLYFTGAACAAVFALAPVAAFARRMSARTRGLLCGALCLLAASFYSVVQPGNAYGHYLMLLVFPVAFLVALLLSALFEIAERSRGPGLAKALKTLVVAVFMIALVLVPFLREVREGKEIFQMARPSDGMLSTRTARKVLEYASPGEKMAAWGWMAGYHAQTGLIMGTRDGVSVRQIEGGPQRAYYRQRYLADLVKSRPPVFLDVVGRRAFKFTDRERYGHEVFPELAEHIARHYRLVAETEGRRIYVSNERLEESGKAP